MSAIDRFHAHLDKCAQCRDHPFDLCAVGDKLLRAAGENALNTLFRKESAKPPTRVMTSSWFDPHTLFDQVELGNRIVSISRTEPKGFKAIDAKIWEFCPSEQLLEDFKLGKINDTQFEYAYIAEVLPGLDAGIAKLKDNDVLCCWEEEGTFCHRVLLAVILKARGIKVDVH